MNLNISELQIHKQYLISAFLAMEPPDHIISLAKICGGGSITEDVQEFIWAHCINRQDAYGHVFYLKNCLKKLITEIESTGGSVLDEFYERYTSYMVSVKEDGIGMDNSWVVKHIPFLFPDGSSGHKQLAVALRCSLNMLQGDTGCALWPSSLFLSEFILSFPEVFTRKSCFEVGSGVGLIGICLQHVEASQVILTDSDASSLANLKVNLEMNKVADVGDPVVGGLNAVECIHLPWESARKKELQRFTPDIVLGADVIYDPSCLPHLIQVLSILLLRKKAVVSTGTRCSDSEGLVPGRCIRNNHISFPSGENASSENILSANSNEAKVQVATMKSLSQEMESRPVALIASVIRNVDTFNCFLDLCLKANIVVRELTESIRFCNMIPYMNSYKRCDVHLFLLST